MSSKWRSLIFVGLVCLFAFFAAGLVCAEEGKKYGKLYLNEYEPRNAEETAIIAMLVEYQAAFNAHDLQKFVSFFTKDGIYRPCGSSSSPIGSKKCQDTLVYNFGSYKFETYYDPQISIDGDKAVVNLLIESGFYLGDYTAWMQKVGKVWRITKNDYANVRYKS
jgi:hypothetical protein